MTISIDVKNKLIEQFFYYVDDLSEHDINHIRLVEEKMVELANPRGLSPTLAEVIAMYHDIGRFRDDLDPDNHSESGANFLKSKLMDLEYADLKVVITAIKEHSRKGKITTPYSELLKDGDVYAHSMDYEIEDVKELIRLEYLDVPPFDFKWKENEGWNKSLNKSLNELLVLLDSNKIHEIRIKIRTIRSLLWLIKDSLPQFKILDDELKDLFKQYELSRKLQVFKKQFNGYTFDNEVDKILKEELDKIKAYIKERHDIIKQLIELSFTDEEINFNYLVQERLCDYIDLINRVNVSKRTSIHKLRIFGKRIKYLMELDLVDYHQEHLNLIKKLHKSIGSFNDVYENKKLVESKLFKATDNEVEIIKSKLKEEKLILNNEIKKEVFAMRLLVSRSFY